LELGRIEKSSLVLFRVTNLAQRYFTCLAYLIGGSTVGNE
jgi:hypothetical protein